MIKALTVYVAGATMLVNLPPTSLYKAAVDPRVQLRKGTSVTDPAARLQLAARDPAQSRPACGRSRGACAQDSVAMVSLAIVTAFVAMMLLRAQASSPRTGRARSASNYAPPTFVGADERS